MIVTIRNINDTGLHSSQKTFKRCDSCPGNRLFHLKIKRKKIKKETFPSRGSNSSKTPFTARHMANSWLWVFS